VVTSRLPALAREPSDEDGYAHNHDSCPYEERSHGFDQKAEDTSKKADEYADDKQDSDRTHKIPHNQQNSLE
jgi:hypothetical protein